MAKFAANSVLDGMLNVIKTATRMTVCQGQPVNFVAIAPLIVAQTVMAPGDYTIANGDTSGRKVTTAAKNTLNVSATGTATYICLDDGTTLLYTTTCASQPLNQGNTVNVPAWKVEVQQPT